MTDMIDMTMMTMITEVEDNFANRNFQYKREYHFFDTLFFFVHYFHKKGNQ